MLWLWGGSAFLAAFLAAGRCSSPPQCLWPSGPVRVRVSVRVSVSVFNFGLVMSLWGFSGCRGCVWRTRRWLVAAGRQLPPRGVEFHRVQLFVWVFICTSVYIFILRAWVAWVAWLSAQWHWVPQLCGTQLAVRMHVAAAAGPHAVLVCYGYGQLGSHGILALCVMVLVGLALQWVALDLLSL